VHGGDGRDGEQPGLEHGGGRGRGRPQERGRRGQPVTQRQPGAEQERTRVQEVRLAGRLDVVAREGGGHDREGDLQPEQGEHDGEPGQWRAGQVAGLDPGQGEDAHRPAAPAPEVSSR
jgi:hypothetical protein